MHGTGKKTTRGSWAAARTVHTLFVLDSVPSHLHVLIAANWL